MHLVDVEGFHWLSTNVELLLEMSDECIAWGTWISALNLMEIHSAFVEIFQSGPKWLTLPPDRPAASVAKKAHKSMFSKHQVLNPHLSFSYFMKVQIKFTECRCLKWLLSSPTAKDKEHHGRLQSKHHWFIHQWGIRHQSELSQKEGKTIQNTLKWLNVFSKVETKHKHRNYLHDRIFNNDQSNQRVTKSDHWCGNPTI